MKNTTLSRILLLAAASSFTFAPLSHASKRDIDDDGIPNATDMDIDNDGLPNGKDDNVDGGVAKSGPHRGKRVGDELKNDSSAEKDIDGDGLVDDSNAELDIDGDAKKDDAANELDIDGDKKSDDAVAELDMDGDGRTDDSAAELDIDGDGRKDGSVEEKDCDGDSKKDSVDEDDDGDGKHDGLDDDENGDGIDDNLPGGIVGDGNAPASLVGITYLLGLEETVSFTSELEATKTEAEEIETLDYTYVSNGTTATLRLSKNEDDYSVYSLNFATGEYSFQRFQKGELKKSDEGIFALGE